MISFRKDLYLLLSVVILFVTILSTSIYFWGSGVAELLILFVSLISIHYLNKKNILFFAIIGILLCFSVTLFGIYLIRDDFKIESHQINYILLRKVFPFIVGIAIGFILFKGAKIKLNSSFKIGIIHIFSLLIILTLFHKIIPINPFVVGSFFLFSAVNGYFSKDRLIKNYFLYMIPFTIYNLFYIVTGLEFEKKIILLLIFIVSSTLIGYLLGYLLAKFLLNKKTI